MTMNPVRPEIETSLDETQEGRIAIPVAANGKRERDVAMRRVDETSDACVRQLSCIR